MVRLSVKTIRLFGTEVRVTVLVIPTRGGSLELPREARLIAQKKLTSSDVSPRQSRLTIPHSNEILQVLLDSERTMIVDEQKSMRVTVMDSGRCYYMDFKKWPSLKRFVLNRGWMKLVDANQLKKDDVIKLWCYRNGSLLGFAVEINHL